MNLLKNFIRAVKKVQAQFESWLDSTTLDTLSRPSQSLAPANAIQPNVSEVLYEPHRGGLTTMLSLDRSGSMNIIHSGKTRLEWAKQAAIRYIAAAKSVQPHARVGIVTFSGTGELVSKPLPVGSHEQPLIDAIEGIKIGTSTNIQAGLDLAYGQFETSFAGDKKLILLTDGDSTDGDELSSANAIKRSGIELNIIGIGGCPKDVNEPTLKKMASRARGKLCYWFIQNVPDLVQRFEALGLQAF